MLFETSKGLIRELQLSDHVELRFLRTRAFLLIFGFPGSAAHHHLRAKSLEFYGIRPGARRHVHELDRAFEGAIVVDAGFGDDEDGTQGSVPSGFKLH